MAVIAALVAAVAARRVSRRLAVASSYPSCAPSTRQLANFARLSVDTIARLRDHAQTPTLVTHEGGFTVVRTEDANPLADHDGGKVSFDCSGAVHFVWLDGG